jgi:chromosome segregation ATPase
MCKKVLIASLAVVIGLAVVANTRLGSHARLWLRGIKSSMAKQVKPEHEIRRLTMEVERLEQQDHAYFHKVAEQRIKVRELEKQLAGDPAKNQKGIRTELAELRTRLTDLRALVKEVKGSEKSGDHKVSYNGGNFTLAEINEQISRDWERYKPLKATVESQEAFLATMKKALAQNEEKLLNLQKARQEMLTQLQSLENELNELRQAKAGKAALLDDSAYGRVRKDIEALSKRLEVEKEALKLKGQVGQGPVEKSEATRAKQKQAEKEMDDELNGAATKATTTKN